MTKTKKESIKSRHKIKNLFREALKKKKKLCGNFPQGGGFEPDPHFSVAIAT